MVVTFECVTHSAKNEHEMFDLARSIDSHTRSQASSGEKAVAGVTDGLIALGQDVTWSARHFGIVFRLTSTVTEFDAPFGPIGRVVEKLVLAPYLRRLIEERGRFLASS